LAACATGVFIYTSTDYGVNWTQQVGSGSRNWVSIASSSDGNKLIACDNTPGYLYTSNDSGIIWTPVGVSKVWTGVASSGDGVTLAACVTTGYVYLSNDSGLTWVPQSYLGSHSWTSVAISTDGGVIMAAWNTAIGRVHTFYSTVATGVTTSTTTSLNYTEILNSSSDLQYGGSNWVVI
jgi:hypothetical protein